MLVIKEKNNILLYMLAAFKNVQKLESHKRNSWICFEQNYATVTVTCNFYLGEISGKGGERS